jgi:hypothetical protein
MKKRKLKGITLVEIIVALCILTVITYGLVMACVSINSTIVHTYRVNRRINYQAPVVENRDKNKSEPAVDSAISFTFAGNTYVADIELYVASRRPEDNGGAFRFFNSKGAADDGRVLDGIETTPEPTAAPTGGASADPDASAPEATTD